MALEKKGSPIVVPAIRVADLPALPDDITDSTGMRKWWDDFRQVLARLIQAKSESQSKEQVVVQAEVAAEASQPEAESKPVDWDDIVNKPEKFPPLDHTHKTPWLQVENPLCLSEVDPDTNIATLGFYEQKAATFLAGPLSGPVAKPVFRPLYTGDDANLDGSGADDSPAPATYDDLMPGGPAAGYTPTFALEDQSKGSDLQLLGYAEYTDASNPTRYYLTETLSGGSTADTWGGAGWTHRTNTISGGATVDPASGAVTSTKACREVYVNELVPEGNADTTKHWEYLSAEDGVAPGSTPTTTVVRTERQITVTGSVLDENHYTNASGTATQTLSRENTEHDVIERAKASLEWATCNSSATAHYTARSANRSMPWQMLRRRAKTISGLKPWGTYTLTFPTETCQQIAGAEWVPGPSKSVAVAADLDGKCAVTDWAELEAERGYSARWSTPITCTPQ